MEMRSRDMCLCFSYRDFVDLMEVNLYRVSHGFFTTSKSVYSVTDMSHQVRVDLS